MPSCWPRFPPCLWAPSLDHTQSTTTKTVMEQHLQFCSCSFHARHLDSTLQPRLHSPAHVQLEGALELSYNQWNVHKCDMRPCINLAYKNFRLLCVFSSSTSLLQICVVTWKPQTEDAASPKWKRLGVLNHHLKESCMAITNTTFGHYVKEKLITMVWSHRGSVVNLLNQLIFPNINMMKLFSPHYLQSDM